MNYQDLVLDFAKRTRRNLEVIEERAQIQSQHEVYEVTQLINSMLGLLVFPKEKFYSRIPRVPLEVLRERGWPIPNCQNAPLKDKHLKGFVKFLRNSIAHFNIDFVEEDGRISGIKLWNINEMNQKDWQVNLKLAELRMIVVKFIEVLKEISENDKSKQAFASSDMGRGPGKRGPSNRDIQRRG